MKTLTITLLLLTLLAPIGCNTSPTSAPSSSVPHCIELYHGDDITVYYSSGAVQSDGNGGYTFIGHEDVGGGFEQPDAPHTINGDVVIYPGVDPTPGS